MMHRNEENTRKSQRIRRRVTLQFDFGLPSPPRMAYTFDKNMIYNNMITLKTFIRLPLLVLLMLLGLGCGQKKANNIGTIINSLGKHPVNGPYFEYIEIRKDDSGRLRKWVGTGNGVNLSENRELANGWFFFVESETRVWTYYGGGQLQLTVYSESAPPQGWAPFAFSEIPPSVVSHLPVGLKEKLEVEQAAPRNR